MNNVDCCTFPQVKKYSNKTILITTTLGFALILFLAPHFSWTQKLSRVLWENTNMMLLPIFIGLILGGMIDDLIPATYVSSFLSRPKKRVLVYSVMLGFLMSACSHGMLALAMELNRKGASKAAVISFLLASPWANLPITILLFGFFGARAFLIVFSALMIALMTGFIFQQLEKAGWLLPNPQTQVFEEPIQIGADLRRRWRGQIWTWGLVSKHLKAIGAGAWSLADMVLPWMYLGLILAAVAAAYVPEHFFHRFLGPHFLGLLSSLGAATVMEVCSEGTAPLAFELYKQTHAFGNVFVFLMAGVVTDFTEIGLVWKNMGHRSALAMIFGALPFVVLLGCIFNLFVS